MSDPTAQTPEQARNYRILIIEDDPDMMLLIRDTLSARFDSTRLHTATTIGAALEYDLRQIDVVLSDFSLPDGDGLKALRSLLAVRPDLPVIMVTGESEITTAVKAIHAGAFDYVIKTPELIQTIPLTVEKNLATWRIQKENARLQQQLKASYDQISQANRQLSDMVTRLQKMALTDALTGLSNRRHLNDILSRLFAEATRYESDLACLMIDMDGFKGVNDTLGHQRGDDLLQLAGRLIKSNCREADIAARYGGDEFVVIMPRTSSDSAINLARRIRDAFQVGTEVLREAEKIELDLCMGIACMKISDPASGEQLVGFADDALYAAKRAGRGLIMLHRPQGIVPVSHILGQPSVQSA